MRTIRNILLSMLMLVAIPALADSININSADADGLQRSLTGIGKVRAEAIIDYREQNGPFEYIDDLMNVEGIGRTTVEVNRDRITLN